jgi:hypothetical protein
MGKTIVFFLGLAGLLASTAAGQSSKAAAPKADQNAIVITFKDGHQETIPLSDVTKMEFKTNSQQTAFRADRASFAGRWQVGTGVGSSTFYITLEPNGTASKTQGAEHGRWAVVGDEARISWDDGWHDIIRRAGNHYEKVAYSPGKSYSDKPSNITEAKNTEPL